MMTMSLGENIQFYRKKAGITQEQLAERLDVSRQSVSKWESNTTYPEMEKLLQMCAMFSCTLDTLLRGDAEIESGDDSEKYEQHMNRFSRTISFGIGLVFAGVALLLALLSAEVAPHLAVVCMLVPTIIGILFMINAGMAHDAFTKKYSRIAPFYTEDQIEQGERRFRFRMTASIGLLLMGVLWVVGSSELPVIYDLGRELYVAFFIFAAGIAITTMTYSGIQKSKYDIENYNKENEPEARTTKKLAEENSPVGKWCGAVIMLSIGTFIVLGLVFQLWHPGWVVFPAAIFLCAAGAIVGGSGVEKK